MRNGLVLIASILIASSACRPAPQTFGDAWSAAARAHDGAAAWSLVDEGSRTRILAALAKTRDAAAKDPAFAVLAKACLAPVDPALPPEEMAKALLASELSAAAGAPVTVSPELRVPAGDRTLALHLESRAWHVEAPALGFASSTGAPVCVSILLPGASDPPAPAIASAQSPRPSTPAVQPFTGDAGSLLAVEETVTRQKTPQGWIASVVHTAGGKTLDYTNRNEETGESVQYDLVKHLLTVRTGHVMTRFRLNDANRELVPSMWHQRYDVVKEGGEEIALLRETAYLDENGGRWRGVAETPIDRDATVVVVRELKDKKGEDLSKMTPEERQSTFAGRDLQEKDRWEDGPVLSVRASSDRPGGLRRAGELLKLDPIAIGQAQALARIWGGRVGQGGVTAVEIVLTPGERPAVSAVLHEGSGKQEQTPALTFGAL